MEARPSESLIPELDPTHPEDEEPSEQKYPLDTVKLWLRRLAEKEIGKTEKEILEAEAEEERRLEEVRAKLKDAA